MGDGDLRTWFSAIQLDWEVVPFSTVGVGFTNWHAVGVVAGLYRMRPGVAGDQAEAAATVASALSLKSSGVG